MDTALTYIIQAQDKASKQLDAIANKLDALDKTAEHTSQSGFGKMKASTIALGVAMGELAVAGVSKLATGFLSLAKSGVKAADDLEKGELKYKTLLGTTEAAQKRVKELVEFANKTPFEFQAIQKGDIILQGFGIRSQKTLDVIGNAAAVSGDSFSDLSLILGQLSQSKGLDNIKQLAERGIISFDELKNAGIKFAKDGSIINSVEDTYGKVVGIMESKFKGGMDNLANTLTGRLSTLKDTIGFALGGIAKDTGLLDLLKSATTKITEYLSSIDWKEVGAKIKAFFMGVAEGAKKLFDEAKKVVGVLKNLAEGFIFAFTEGDAWNDTLGEGLQALGLSREATQKFMTVLQKVVDIVKSIPEQFDKFKESVSNFVNSEPVQKFLEILGESIGNMVENLKEAFETLKPKIEELAAKFQEWYVKVQPIIEIILQIAGVIIGVLIVAIFKLVELITAILGPTLSFLIDVFMFLGDIVATVWRGIYDAIAFVIDWIVNTAVPWITAAFTNISNFITTTFTAVSNFITSTWEFIKNVFNTSVEFIKAVVLAAWQFIYDTIISKLIAVWEWISPFLFSLVNFFTSIFTSIFNVTVLLFNWIKDHIISVFNAIWNFLNPILNTIWNFISGVWNGIYNTISGIVNSVWNVISSVFNRVKDTIFGVFNSIRDTVSSLFQKTMDSVVQPAETMWNRVQDVFNKMKNFIGDTFSGIKNTGEGIFDGVIDGVKKGINYVIDLLNTAINNINNTVIDNLNKVPGVSISKISNIPHLEKGGTFDTDGPQLFVAGDGASRRERVTVEPLSGPYASSNGQSSNSYNNQKSVNVETLVINNNMDYQVFLNKLAMNL